MTLRLTSKIIKEGEIPIAKTDSGYYLYIKKDDTPFKPIVGFECQYCNKIFTTKQSMEYHIKNACRSHNTDIDKKYYSKCEHNDKFKYIPQLDREIIYITGPPKCGKTTVVNNYCKAAKSIYGKNIYYFSAINDDDTLKNDIDIYNKIDINDDILNKDYSWDAFPDSVCIFDDIENSRYPKAVQFIFDLINDIIRNGRHSGKYGTTIIYTSQICKNGLKSKVILENATSYVVFPNVANECSLTKLFKEYAGISKRGLSYLRKTPNNWTLISIAVPRYVLTDNECFVLDKNNYIQ